MTVNREVAFPNIKPADLTNMVRFDQGCFGSIFKCFYRPFGAVTVKFSMSQKRSDQEDLRKEFAFLVQYGTCHPNIVQTYGLVDDPMDGAGIVMEYVAGGTLEDIMFREDIVYNVDHIVHWMVQLASAVSYIHSCNVIHRDLKPANILLDRSYSTVKLCDFGFARTVDLQMSYRTGTWCWMAPEVMAPERVNDGGYESAYGSKCDVYSLGIILWQLISREKPFDRLGLLSEIDCVRKVGQEGLRPPLLGCLEELEELYTWCWENNPAHRISSEDLRDHLHEMQRIHSEGWMPLMELTESHTLQKPTGCFIGNTLLETDDQRKDQKADFLKSVQMSRRQHMESVRFLQASVNPNNTNDYIDLSANEEENLTDEEEVIEHREDRYRQPADDHSAPILHSRGTLPAIVEIAPTPLSSAPHSFYDSGENSSEREAETPATGGGSPVAANPHYENDTASDDGEQHLTDTETDPVQVHTVSSQFEDLGSESGDYDSQRIHNSIQSNQSDPWELISNRSVDTVMSGGQSGMRPQDYNAPKLEHQQRPLELYQYSAPRENAMYDSPMPQRSPYQDGSAGNIDYTRQSRSSIGSGPSRDSRSPVTPGANRHSIEDQIIKGKMGSPLSALGHIRPLQLDESFNYKKYEECRKSLNGSISPEFNNEQSVKYTATLAMVDSVRDPAHQNQRDQKRAVVDQWEVRDGIVVGGQKNTYDHQQPEQGRRHYDTSEQGRRHYDTSARTTRSSGSTSSPTSQADRPRESPSSRVVVFDVPPSPLETSPVAGTSRMGTRQQTPSTPSSTARRTQNLGADSGFVDFSRSTRVPREQYNFEARRRMFEKK